MRFGHKQSDPLRNPKSHRRLFGQVMLLGFMLIAVQWAAQGRHWTWLVPEKTAGQPELKPLDFKVKTRTASPLAPGEVRIAVETSLPQAAEAGTLASVLPGDTLTSMDDGRLGMLRTEQAAVDQVVAQVRGLNAESLLQSARRDVGFVELNDRPAEHRGQLLAFRGTLWRLTPLQDIYEAWIITADAANNPTRVLLTELPAGFVPGNQIDRQVEFAGYFIKRYGYATEGSTHVAPMFVARTLVPVKMPGVAQRLRPEQTWTQWISGLVVAGFATLFLLRRLSREMRRPEKRELPETLPPLPVSPEPAPISDNFSG